MLIEMSEGSFPQLRQHLAGSEGQVDDVATKSQYTIKEEPLGSAKHVRIVIIGAGASGLNMIRTLRLNLTNYEVRVYEKNENIGGTWFENRYPGCRCDVPSHNYQFSWRPNLEWSNFFAPAHEIAEYLNTVCDEEGMRDSIRTLHQVTSARWNEGKGTWELRVRDLATGTEFHDYADFLLDGTGILNNWSWPDIAGLQSFQGDLIHTARWPKDFDCTGKVVAVIGNGSTGVQLLPEIQPSVKRLYHVIRAPTWVIPPRIQVMMLMGSDKAKEVLSQIDLDEKENFSARTIEKFKSDPEFYRYFVKCIEKDFNNAFPIILKDGPVQAFARAKTVEYMTAMLGGDAKLCKELIPQYPLGVRRMTPAPGYLQALRQPNVEVKINNIKRLVREGIELETGEILKVDAIICATGFNISFCPRFPLIGRRGNLQDIRRKELPKSYLSCAVAGLPNYFTFLGPQAPIGHGSVFTLTEHIAKYIARVIRKCQTEGIKALSPQQTAVDDYAEHIASFMPRTTWAVHGCRSWFKAGRADGPVIALHPGSRIHFFHMLEQFRGEDWEYVYDDAPSSESSDGAGKKGNRFRYLGNGFSSRELDPNFDVTWYLDSEAGAV